MEIVIVEFESGAGGRESVEASQVDGQVPKILGNALATWARLSPGIQASVEWTTGAYRCLREQGHDLHELHALICPRPFFVSGGSEDTPERWTALNHAIQVNELLGTKARVGMSNRPEHAPNASSNEQLYSFFQHFLNSDSLGRRQ